MQNNLQNLPSNSLNFSSSPVRHLLLGSGIQNFHTLFETGKNPETVVVSGFSVLASILSAQHGCGSWIRTNDLRVMSPTSYPCSTPRYSVHSPECLYIITRSLMFVKRFTKKIYKKSKFPLKPLLSLCLSVIIYAAVP